MKYGRREIFKNKLSLKVKKEKRPLVFTWVCNRKVIFPYNEFKLLFKLILILNKVIKFSELYVFKKVAANSQ